MSAEVVTFSSRSCSGAIHPGLPMTMPVWVWLVAVFIARAMPKSITRGPDSDSSTFAGLRSRWTSPVRWMAASAAATPRAKPCRVEESSGPFSAMCSANAVPAMYSVTMYGRFSNVPWSRTFAVQKEATLRAFSISSRNRARVCSSNASSGRITLMATWLFLSGRLPRYTVPIPPLPSFPDSM